MYVGVGERDSRIGNHMGRGAVHDRVMEETYSGLTVADVTVCARCSRTRVSGWSCSPTALDSAARSPRYPATRPMRQPPAEDLLAVATDDSRVRSARFDPHERSYTVVIDAPTTMAAFATVSRLFEPVFGNQWWAQVAAVPHFN
jgi:hypothetical protein